MKMEVFPRNEGFTVMFLDADLATVAKIKEFSVALLSGMGYRFEAIKTEEGDDLLFFNIASSVDDRRLRLKDLFNSLNEATKKKNMKGDK